VLPHLRQKSLYDPYFSKAPPKSTGRDLFSQTWLQDHLSVFAAAAPADVQATLAELTEQACGADVLRWQPDLRHLIVCGGGALNSHLMRRLGALLPNAQVTSSAGWGLPPLRVEPTAFAWLARKTMLGEKLELQSTTGARGARVLGCVYPA